MLETYFVRPDTVERIRASWIGTEVERYVGWMAEQGYGPRCIWRRVPQAVAFGDFARRHGATAVSELAAHVDAYVMDRVATYRGVRKDGAAALQVAKEVRVPEGHIVITTAALLTLVPVLGPGYAPQYAWWWPSWPPARSRSGVTRLSPSGPRGGPG
jgi:hypothetical protein